MRGIPVLLLLGACSTLAPEPLSSNERRASAGLTSASLYDGQTSSAELSVRGCADCDVVLLASPTTGQGPCYRGVCLDLGPSGQVVGREAVASRTRVEVAFDLTAWNVVPGQTIHLQAVLLRRGQLIGRTAAGSAVVVETVPGCPFPGDPLYDPRVTLPDGSCTCAEQVYASTQAELTPLAACSGVVRVELVHYADPVASIPGRVGSVWVFDSAALREVILPDVTEMGDITLDQLPNLTRLSAPSLAKVDSVSLWWTPSLAAAELPALEGVGELAVVGASLSSLDLPSLIEVSASLIVAENQTPVTVRAPLLRELNLGLESNLGAVSLDAPALAAAAIDLVGHAGLASTAIPGVSSLVVNLIDSDLQHVDTGGATDAQISAVRSDLVSVTAPGVTAGAISIEGAPALTHIDAPLLAEASRLEIEAAGALTSLALPSLVTAGYVVIESNPALSQVDLPSLTGWVQASLQDNPAWCVGAPFDAPPPGAVVTGTGNLCDP